MLFFWFAISLNVKDKNLKIKQIKVVKSKNPK